MAKSLEFGRSVLVMDADDSKLEAALKADEQLVTQSVNKMQGNLNKLEVSMGATGGGATAAAAGVSALGAAASASGSAAAQSAAQLGTLGVALSATASAAAAAKVQLVGAATAAAAFLITPLGIAVAALAAGLAVLALAWKSAGDEAEIAREQMERAMAMRTERLSLIAKIMVDQVVIEDQILVAQGRITKELAAEFALRRKLGESGDLSREQIEARVAVQSKLTAVLKANADAAVELAQADKDAAAKQAREGKLSALRDELAILSSSLTKYDLIADAEERGLRIAIDQTREMQEQAKLAEDRARAERERFEGKGPKTAGEAEALVRGSLQLAEANQRSAALVREAVDNLKTMGIDSKMLEKVAQSLGAGATPTTTRFGQGALELSAFAATGRGGAVGGTDPVQAARIAKEDKRTKAVESIDKSVDRLLNAMSRWNPGAS